MPAWGVRTALLALRSFMMQEAEGQVGGLACGENERKQMAAASKDWTCGTCARSNGEIMKEADQAFAAAGQKSDELVPEELKLGYREDTQPAAQQDGHAQAGPSIASKSAPASSAHLPLGHDTDAELAEGFVPTRPASHSPKRQTYMSPNQLEPIDFPSPNLPVALPGQSIPTPTSQRVPDFQADAYPPYMDDPVRGAEQRRRHFNANHGSQTVGDGNAQMAQQVREHLQQNNVPVWIDRAIAALGLLLVCLVLKMIFK